MFLCKEHREGWRLGNVKGVHILFLKAVFWLLCIRFALLFFPVSTALWSGAGFSL
jgi:hypothetical protein